MSEYNKLRSPKRIMLAVTPLDRQIQRSMINSIDQLEFDDELFNRLRDKFTGLIKEINEGTNSEVSPLMILHLHGDLLKKHEISIVPIRKYFAIRQTMTDKEIVRKRIYTRQWINKLKVKIKLANDVLIAHGLNNTLSLLVLPEKIIYDPDMYES